MQSIQGVENPARVAGFNPVAYVVVDGRFPGCNSHSNVSVTKVPQSSTATAAGLSVGQMDTGSQGQR